LFINKNILSTPITNLWDGYCVSKILSYNEKYGQLITDCITGILTLLYLYFIKLVLYVYKRVIRDGDTIVITKLDFNNQIMKSTNVFFICIQLENILSILKDLTKYISSL